MIHVFGTSQAVASRTTLLAVLNGLRARGGRKVTAAKVAKRLGQRGKIEAQDVLDVAAANSSLIATSGSTIGLTGAGLTAARSRMSPRWHIVGD